MVVPPCLRFLQELGYGLSALEAAKLERADEGDRDDEEPVCRVCGGTEDAPCPGGCSWVPDPAMGEPVQRVRGRDGQRMTKGKVAIAAV
jgi:hypothetical protein